MLLNLNILDVRFDVLVAEVSAEPTRWFGIFETRQVIELNPNMPLPSADGVYLTLKVRRQTFGQMVDHAAVMREVAEIEDKQHATYSSWAVEHGLYYEKALAIYNSCLTHALLIDDDETRQKVLNELRGFCRSYGLDSRPVVEDHHALVSRVYKTHYDRFVIEHPREQLILNHDDTYANFQRLFKAFCDDKDNDTTLSYTFNDKLSAKIKQLKRDQRLYRTITVMLNPKGLSKYILK